MPNRKNQIKRTKSQMARTKPQIPKIPNPRQVYGADLLVVVIYFGSWFLVPGIFS